jgi:hypothetical protein
MTLRRSFLRRLLPIAVLATGLAAAAPAPPPAPAQPAAPAAPAAQAVPRTLDVPDGALVAAGKAPEVDLLFTGDVIGYIEPCG